MPAHEFFERQTPRFALQADAAKKTADDQATAERLIAKAEYECQQMRRDLLAAFAVPLSHRAVEVPVPVEPEPAAATVNSGHRGGAAKAA